MQIIGTPQVIKVFTCMGQLETHRGTLNTVIRRCLYRCMQLLSFYCTWNWVWLVIVLNVDIGTPLAKIVSTWDQKSSSPRAMKTPTGFYPFFPVSRWTTNTEYTCKIAWNDALICNELEIFGLYFSRKYPILKYGKAPTTTVFFRNFVV